MTCEHGYGAEGCTYPSCPNAAPERPLPSKTSSPTTKLKELIADAELGQENATDVYWRGWFAGREGAFREALTLALWRESKLRKWMIWRGYSGPDADSIIRRIEESDD